MKLPGDSPFVILDQNLYGTQLSARLTDDFIEWIVRDCAKVCADLGRLKSASAEECAESILKRYGLEAK